MKLRKLIFVTFVIVCAAALTAQAQEMAGDQRKPNNAQPPPAIEYLQGKTSGSAPLSEAVRVGSMLFLSGQLGINGTGSLVPGGIKSETRQALENLRTILEKNGSGIDRVVKCTVMLADIADRNAMNEVYASFFPKDRFPARSAFATAGLVFGARVEIECVAVIR